MTLSTRQRNTFDFARAPVLGGAFQASCLFKNCDILTRYWFNFCRSGCLRGMSGVVNIWSLHDGSLLHTNTGSGGVQSLCWIDNVALAICFTRSKVIISKGFCSYEILIHLCAGYSSSAHIPRLAWERAAACKRQNGADVARTWRSA